MFEYLRSLFSHDLVIELSSKQITVSIFGQGIEFQDEPLIAIQGEAEKSVIVEIGASCRTLQQPNIEVTNPFNHSRSLIGSFMMAEKVLQHAVLKSHKSKLRPAPRIIMHQLEKAEGGLTDIEDRVLRELAAASGAREVLIHTGSKIDIHQHTFDSFKRQQQNQ
ncbi:rod shape-determining protein [Paraferrimonas sp. SM1919]|uniref:rod shape-determining protein n=1 Tax=Paraferrimonas sp. SM1919 TaxID=2662263 RepID=UPI0013D04FF6|nr:rod shape-determining protein [Paraferrimonas sp. SM1919]